MLIAFLLLTLTGSSFGTKTTVQPNQPKLESRQFDQRAQVLSDYFASYNSPLQYQAQDFVDAADKYNLDWKLVPAISGVESTFGKSAYGYNAWGWGIYGNEALGFNSWKDGIYAVSEGLRQNYFDRGLSDPYAINRVYAASPSWGWKVNFFLNDLDRFATLHHV